MPEGPEVRREADRISRVLTGEQPEQVWFAFDYLRPWSERMAARTIDAVESRGKALLIRFDDGLNIYSHNQLYGRWYVVPRGRTPKTTRQLRLALHTERQSALLYSASEIEVLVDDEVDQHPYLAKLGPDALDKRVRADDVLAQLQSDRFRRRSLGALLLDQSFVSGLGNYLRSEILFVAHLGPDLRPTDLEDGQRRELARAILSIARRAYRHRGVTNDPDDARELKALGVRRREYRHYVFSRARKPCRLCGVSVEKRTSAGRRFYFCPACQSR